MTEQTEEQKPDIKANQERMDKIQNQIQELMVQYKSEKDAVKNLRESIDRVKELKSELHDKKVADAKRVDDLKTELEMIKARKARREETAKTAAEEANKAMNEEKDTAAAKTEETVVIP